ncbi:hypothetical protein V496_04618 [Pseudogymnoascus sp. VKM F-4515 (FW-2607)]|nr:hypothetical protein V496_04618 [Pseudogymnoascus sp. VKM F-4515 (FW-2607)]
MSRYTQVNYDTRDSLELASLASSSPDGRASTDSSSSQGVSSSRKLSLEAEDPLDSHNAAADGRPAGHNRTFSTSSAFEFTSNLFPLSSTTASGYARIGEAIAPSGPTTGLGGVSLEKHKTLTYLNGLSLIVGLIIGSGIFSSPGQVVTRAGSPGASLIIWVIAGVLAWTGAASYAELGGAIPLNGGPQVYLSKIFGELFGFLFTWCAVVVLKPGSTAIIAIIFGEYLVRAIVGAEAESVNPWINKGVALFGLFLLLYWVLQLLGSLWPLPDTLHQEKQIATGKLMDGSKTNYVVGEFRNPGRDLPRVIHTAMPMVIASYLLANVAYFFVLPLDSIKSTNTVAVLFGAKVFGTAGSLILSLIVSASCLGALNATAFTSGRLVYAAGKEGYLPSILGKVGVGSQAEQPSLSTLRTRSWLSKKLAGLFGDSETGLFFTPVNALLFNALVAVVYIIIGDFSTLLTFYGVAGYTFYFLTVLGLIVLRVREPHLERPYKTWISTPIIFCCRSGVSEAERKWGKAVVEVLETLKQRR